MKKGGDFKIIDDFFDEEYQEEIKGYLMGDWGEKMKMMFSLWDYIDDVSAAYEEIIKGRPCPFFISRIFRRWI
ncbi:MAG: hypothetical protein CM15mV31_0930 [uncultured marine virus]|nr:MAG: hypothetical protein CM15mV31_0930 [uncultured marine virus]